MKNTTIQFSAELKRETEKAIQVSTRIEFYDSMGSSRMWSFWMPKSRISFEIINNINTCIITSESWIVEKAIAECANFYEISTNGGHLETELESDEIAA